MVRQIAAILQKAIVESLGGSHGRKQVFGSLMLSFAEPSKFLHVPIEHQDSESHEAVGLRGFRVEDIILADHLRRKIEDLVDTGIINYCYCIGADRRRTG